jgi:hypothetical protein
MRLEDMHRPSGPAVILKSFLLVLEALPFSKKNRLTLGITILLYGPAIRQLPF